MAGPNHVAYSSIAEIEEMMVNLGTAELKRRGIGRYSNYDAWAPERQAVLHPENKVVIGRVFQHVTAKDGPVRPRSVIFIYEKTSTGSLYLLKTTKGCGTNSTLKYYVYCSDGSFTREVCVFAHTGSKIPTNPAVAPVAPVVTNTGHSQANTDQASHNTHSIPPPSAITQSEEDILSPVPVEDKNPEPKAASAADDNDNKDGPNGAASEGTSAAPKTAKSKQVVGKGKKAKIQSVSFADTPAPAIPRSFAGIKKAERKPQVTVPPRAGSARIRNKGLAIVEALGTREEEFRQATHAGEAQVKPAGGLYKIPSTAKIFAPRKEIKPASFENPLPKSAVTGKKRKRTSEDDMNDQIIHERSKRLLTGWYTKEEKAAKEPKTLVGFNVIARVVNIPKSVSQDIPFPQFVLDNKKTLIRYDSDPSRIYGDAYPKGKALQAEFDARPKNNLAKPVWFGNVEKRPEREKREVFDDEEMLEEEDSEQEVEEEVEKKLERTTRARIKEKE